MNYKEMLINLVGKMSEKSVKRIYQLAKYLYIYKE